MRLPNFLIIGAAKSGTTSLYAYLKQHPRIFMSNRKEPGFFGHAGEDGVFGGPPPHLPVITSFDAYAALFMSVADQPAIGEASVHYLYLPKAPGLIKQYIPNATLFAILRNPAERAYSAYLHAVRQGREPLSFAEALREEPARIHDRWSPFWHREAMGYYHKQLQRYFALFSRQQIHVYLYQDFQKQPAALAKQMFEILGVDTSFVPDTSEQFKVAAVPRIKSLQGVLRTCIRVSRRSRSHTSRPFRLALDKLSNAARTIQDWNQVRQPPMPAEIRAAMLATYREDILRLQDLLCRDLSEWLVESGSAVQE